MTKIDYRKQSNKEKNLNYKLRFFGGLVAVIGLIIVLISFFVISNTTYQIFGFTIGAIVAFIGLILDVVGEIILLDEYKELEK